ncbi:hypothetical protein [Streptomyces sp. NPDC058653]|uniref:hypothetical protein n=1 Tax=Streptomyces sp. NPDC058653 TaxID=3346576 RepID=UPI003657E730
MESGRAGGRAGAGPTGLMHAERHPVGERLLHNTGAQVAPARPGPQTDALRDVFSSLMVFDEVNEYLGGVITALDIRYPAAGDHPLEGRRLPDADL